MDDLELRRTLDEHDGLVVRCATGAFTFDEFAAAYDNFYARAALDGHEGSREVLVRYAARIEVHRRVWDDVLLLVTSAELSGTPEAQRAGFISPAQAQLRLREIAESAGLLRGAAG